MTLSTVAILFLLFVARGYAQNQDDCPDEVEACNVDPCQNQECPRFLDATCRPNLCYGGLCTANFFKNNKKNVTDRCGESCDTKVCDKKRQCTEMEECTPSNLVCRRRFLRTQCTLVLVIESPMTCANLTCGPDMGCRMRIREEEGFPPVVRCVSLDRIGKCDDIFCDAGLTCIEERNSVRCVSITAAPPTTPTDAPPLCGQEDLDFCRQLGLVCTITNDGTSTCEIASSCEELECNEDYECLEFLSITFATCIKINATCGNTDCPEDSECTMQFDFPFCFLVVGVSCEELSCGVYDRICVEDGDFSRCVRPSDCTELEPICKDNSIEGFCEEVEGVPVCMTPTSCDQITCEDPFVCIETKLFSFAPIVQCIFNSLPQSCAIIECNGTCLNLTQNGQTVRPYCTRFNCEQGDECPSPLPSACIDTSMLGPEISSVCAPIDTPSLMLGISCNERVDECELFGQVCEEISNQLGSLCSFPVPLGLEGESCDDVTCTDNEICVETTAPLFDPSYLLLQCLDISGGSGDIPAPPATCDQITCEDPFVCTETKALSSEVPVVQCIPNGVPQSCATTECNGACLDLTQNGKTVGPYCTLYNCEVGDKCPSSLPSACIDTLMLGPEISSACVPDTPSFKLGVSCNERVDECEPFGEVCAEISLGSLCSFPVLFGLEGESCEDVTCSGNEVCIETTTPLFDPSYLLLQCV